MQVTTRNWIDNFKKGVMMGDDASYFSSGDYSFGANFYGVQKDTRFDAQTATALAMAEPVFFGIFTKISNAVNALEKKVYEIDKNGKPFESKKSKKILQWYKEAGKKHIEQQMLVSAFGTGMGGGVCFPVKKSGELVFRFEPYILEGKARVGLVGDNGINNEILKVVILDQNGSEIPQYTFEGKRLEKYLYHYRYLNPNGTAGFGSNGLIGAMRAMSLRRAFDQTNEATAKNGLKQSGMVSLDTTKLQDKNGNGLDGKTLNALMGKTEELIQNSTGIRNAGGVLFAGRLPLVFTPTSLNNSQNRTIEYKKFSEEDIWLSLGMDKANWQSKDSKYDNLERANDQMFKDLGWFLRGQEELGEWCMRFCPFWEEGKFIYRTERQFSSEEIRLREAKSKEMASFTQNLKILNETYSSIGHSILPTEEKMATMLSEGLVFHLNSEPIKLQPAESDNIADDFTQVTNAEAIYRNKTDFMDNLKKRVHKSFESVLNS